MVRGMGILALVMVVVIVVAVVVDVVAGVVVVTFVDVVRYCNALRRNK